ncbi:MAG: OmpA family protein [candidate division Zixibacteria bacterium]|nr:OmpA family protein [candidate division Zixibacteria bacterium]
MKRTLIIVLVLMLLSASVSMAIEWKGRKGLGLRGPLFAPMIAGDQYDGTGFGASNNEPFMMGLGGNLEFKYGLSNSLVLGLSGGYWFTYNDIVSTDDQSFKLNNEDNASIKLTVIPLGLSGQYYFIPESNVQPFLLAGLNIDMASYEDLASGVSYSSTDLFVKVGAGFNFWLGESFAFDLSGRFSYLISNMSNDFPTGDVDMGDASSRPFLGVLQPSIGITYFIGGARDTDKDGVKDKFDQCPDTPEGALVDQYGCPLDSDGDGVYDGIDLCENTPAGAIVDISGCPIDTDTDGVPDGIDLCPDTPIGIEVDIYGCPLDNDKDGVPDFKDQQLDTPLGALVDETGVALDTDGDSVPDGIDKCPETGEGVAVDEFGCPLAKPITEKIILNIQYAAGSADPDEPAITILDDLAERMKIYTDVNIEINGYTDALGRAISNSKLSEARAQAVQDYLESKGISADRMTAKGFGEEERFFVATNDTPEGRQANRRVEIVPVQ